MKVTFKSWDQRYKSPFGAIQANTEVTWSVKVEEEIQEVTLWLTKVNEDAVAYPLS